jgi:hypothetical protein
MHPLRGLQTVLPCTCPQQAFRSVKQVLAARPLCNCIQPAAVLFPAGLHPGNSNSLQSINLSMSHCQVTIRLRPPCLVGSVGADNLSVTVYCGTVNKLRTAVAVSGCPFACTSQQEKPLWPKERLLMLLHRLWLHSVSAVPTGSLIDQ